MLHYQMALAEVEHQENLKHSALVDSVNLVLREEEEQVVVFVDRTLAVGLLVEYLELL